MHACGMDTLILSETHIQRVMFSGLTHNIDGKNTLAWYVQRTSRTVSLSHQHLITFNVCVWRTTKAWITVPGRPAHLQHHWHRVNLWLKSSCYAVQDGKHLRSIHHQACKMTIQQSRALNPMARKAIHLSARDVKGGFLFYFCFFSSVKTEQKK